MPPSRKPWLQALPKQRKLRRNASGVCRSPSCSAGGEAGRQTRTMAPPSKAAKPPSRKARSGQKGYGDCRERDEQVIRGGVQADQGEAATGMLHPQGSQDRTDTEADGPEHGGQAEKDEPAGRLGHGSLLVRPDMPFAGNRGV